MANEIVWVPSLVTHVRLYLKRIFRQLTRAIGDYRDALQRLMGIASNGGLAGTTGLELFRLVSSLHLTIGVCEAYLEELRQLVLDLRAAFPDSGPGFPI